MNKNYEVNITPDHVMSTLRMQAWFRAKGELEAVIAAWWGRSDESVEDVKKIRDFIKDIEENTCIV